MPAHCTRPTVVRRLTTPTLLSAAALIAACDQPASPSRPDTRILADAQGGTVSAHGSGTVTGTSCSFTPSLSCSFGGRGLKFNFDFSGSNTVSPVPVTGTWSASDPETNIQLNYRSGSGPAFVEPTNHRLEVSGLCDLTAPDGTTLPGGCMLCAFDGASNGATDLITFFGGNAGISAIIQTTDPSSCLENQLASGNINID